MDIEILIPIVALSIPIVAIWTRHKYKMAQLQIAHSGEDDAEFASSIAVLEKRVRVLERIITDNEKGQDIAMQIEALRDSDLEDTRVEVNAR